MPRPADREGASSRVETMRAAFAVRMDESHACPLCAKQWQEGSTSAGGLGPFSNTHQCEKCHTFWLIAYKLRMAPDGSGLEVLCAGKAQLFGKSEQAYREALARIPGLTDDDRTILAFTARLRAAAVAKTKEPKDEQAQAEA